MNKQKIHIEDTYKNVITKNIMSGKELNDYQLFITSMVLVYYDKLSRENESNENPDTKEIREKIRNCINKSDNYKLLITSLKKTFDCESIECVYANALLAYNGKDITGNKLQLLIRSFNFAGRIQQLNKSDDWLDNWRINAFGCVFSFIMWKSFENDTSEHLFTINREFVPIKSNVQIDFDRYVTYCVGILREFVIRLGVYPDTDIDKFLKGKDYRKIELRNLTNEEIADESYKHFPINYIGSHGCNALYEGKYTCHISEISTFLDRYPAAVYEGVFNTSTYNSPGQHWLTLAFYR